MTEGKSSWLIWTSCSACRDHVTHFDKSCVFGCECKFSDCCFTGAHMICTDKGHTDLHCHPAACAWSIFCSCDDGWDVYCLPGGLAYCCLDLFCLVCGEFIVNVDNELLIYFILKGFITCEYFHIAVIYYCRMCFDHV